MPKISIRQAKKEDLDKLVAIVKKLPYYFVPEYVHDVEEDIKNEESLAAFSDKDILGFINFKIRSQDMAEILWMAADPTTQNQGVGSQLMTAFLLSMKKRGIKKVEVTTIASTDSSIEFKGTRRFYEKHGFKEVKIEKDYYGPGDDRGTMEKTL